MSVTWDLLILLLLPSFFREKNIYNEIKKEIFKFINYGFQ